MTPWIVACLWNFPGKNTGVGCHFLLQRDLPDPGIGPKFPLQTGSLPSEPRNPPGVRIFHLLIASTDCIFLPSCELFKDGGFAFFTALSSTSRTAPGALVQRLNSRKVMLTFWCCYRDKRICKRVSNHSPVSKAQAPVEEVSPPPTPTRAQTSLPFKLRSALGFVSA